MGVRLKESGWSLEVIRLYGTITSVSKCGSTFLFLGDSARRVGNMEIPFGRAGLESSPDD